MTNRRRFWLIEFCNDQSQRQILLRDKPSALRSDRPLDAGLPIPNGPGADDPPEQVLAYHVRILQACDLLLSLCVCCDDPPACDQRPATPPARRGVAAAANRRAADGRPPRRAALALRRAGDRRPRRAVPARCRCAFTTTPPTSPAPCAAAPRRACFRSSSSPRAAGCDATAGIASFPMQPLDLPRLLCLSPASSLLPGDGRLRRDAARPNLHRDRPQRRRRAGRAVADQGRPAGRGAVAVGRPVADSGRTRTCPARCRRSRCQPAAEATIGPRTGRFGGSTRAILGHLFHARDAAGHGRRQDRRRRPRPRRPQAGPELCPRRPRRPGSRRADVRRRAAAGDAGGASPAKLSPEPETSNRERSGPRTGRRRHSSPASASSPSATPAPPTTTPAATAPATCSRPPATAVVERTLLRDEPVQLAAVLDQWLYRDDLDAVLTIGGTGVSARDRSIGVVRERLGPRTARLRRTVPPTQSYAEIGPAALLSRALGGVSGPPNPSALFALPGSVNAVSLAVEKLIIPTLPHLLRELRKDSLRLTRRLGRRIPSAPATPRPHRLVA